MISQWIWWLSESTGIPLGRFAPYIFGGMIGCKGEQIKKPTNKGADNETR